MLKLVNTVHQNPICKKFPLTYSDAIDTRQNKLAILYCHRAISKRSLSYTAFKLWNQKVPTDLKSEKLLKLSNKKKAPIELYQCLRNENPHHH